MNRILVPTDFSPTAKKALDYAVCLAKKSGAQIIITHACELLHNPFQDQKEVIAEYNHTVQKGANDQLDVLKKSIEETENLRVETQVYDAGVIESILQAADVNGADLIVMGTLGRTGLRNKILGSRTAELLSESNVPVITVPYDYEWSEPRRILIAIADPTENFTVLQPAFAIAELFQADVKAAVFSGAHAEGVDVMAHSRSICNIQESLHKIFDKTAVKTVHLGGPDFADAVQQYIKANNIDLLVMITHKRKKIERLFYRSLTREMNYHTTVPLLSIHAST